MASLSKSYTKEKLTGKVYTPRFVVDKILDDICFVGKNILGKTILDPACGDGRFLMAVAERIIKNSELSDLKLNLEKIYGWDIDKQAINECINSLNTLVKDYSIAINWNIKVYNSLEKLKKNNIFQQSDTQKFDFIIGNPPYIRIQHLEDKQRKYIQQNPLKRKNDIFYNF